MKAEDDAHDRIKEAQEAEGDAYDAENLPEEGDRVQVPTSAGSHLEGLVDYVIGPGLPLPGLPVVTEVTVVVLVDKVVVDKLALPDVPTFPHSVSASRVVVVKRKADMELSQERIDYQDRMHAKDRKRLGLSAR